MQAVLMAGGKGTRLRPYTAVLPKPLVPIDDIPIIEMVLRQLKHFGFTEIIVTVGYKAEIILAVLGDGKRFGLEVRYFIEKEKPLGTIGSLNNIPDLDENFLVMNGDICTNLDFSKIFEHHVSSGVLATIGTYSRKEKVELGVIRCNDKGEIEGFTEKPTNHYLVSMGVNAFNRKVLELIPKNEFFGFDSLMHRLIKDQIKTNSFIFEGRWLDIGRPDDYDRMCIEFKEDRHVYLPEGV